MASLIINDLSIEDLNKVLQSLSESYILNVIKENKLCVKNSKERLEWLKTQIKHQGRGEIKQSTLFKICQNKGYNKCYNTYSRDIRKIEAEGFIKRIKCVGGTEGSFNTIIYGGN